MCSYGYSNQRVVHLSIPICWSIVEGVTYSILFICLLMHSHSIDIQNRKSVFYGLIVIATALIVLFAIFQEEAPGWIIVYIVVEVHVLIEGWSILFGLKKFENGYEWMDSITKRIPTRLRQKLHEIQYFFHPQSPSFFWYQMAVEVIEFLSLVALHRPSSQSGTGVTGFLEEHHVDCNGFTELHAQKIVS